MGKAERWTAAPAHHDFTAATNYLSLLLDEATVREVVDRLRTAPITTRKAKDLLRASRLGLLANDDPEVMVDWRKIKKGVKLSPVLLVRGDPECNRPLTIADGYHRICTSYYLDEDAEIPCRLVGLKASSNSPKPRAKTG